MPSASSLSRQWTQNTSPSTDTVMVPGVSVMELARITFAMLVFKSVLKYTSMGSGTRRGERIIRSTQTFALTISFTSTQKYAPDRGTIRQKYRSFSQL